ncbi:MAG: hypothetical protein MJ158_02800 [Alphaproteobacteria bacterium]|nr:hypothetical protein [Alphaproteobacteria bacterium]
MKRIKTSFLLTLLCVIVTPITVFSASRVIKTDNTETVEKKTTVSRVARTTDKGNVDTSRKVSKGVASRVVKTNADTQTQKTSHSVVSRSSVAGNSRAKLEKTVNNSGLTQRVAAASINSNPTVRRAGLTLRPSTAEVGGRATISGTNIQTGSNIDEQVRGAQQSRASISSLFGGGKKNVTPTAESIAAAKDVLEKTAELNSTCQQQYNDCMDQFCAVVDNNQKRCSCSANLAKYEKVEKAVKDANSELNEVAQRIRYIGLSADEISAIMSATEAEEELSKTKDNTETRSMLDDIAELIKDPSISANTSTSGSGASSLIDMDLDFSDSDMFSLDMFSNNSKSISNMRGQELYKEATKRCKAVLNSCKDAGGTESQITGNYDLAIDKDCVAYEQGLVKLNDTLISNVKSAKLMLQKARLTVLQDKNQYDAKGCVAALETCMTDDLVCGENYFKCLDPTKKFIDENGNVVLGQDITQITKFMTDYDNAEITPEFLQSARSATNSDNTGALVVKYLLLKIGTGSTYKDGGLCRSVLDKCQYFTYKTNGKNSTYLPYNEIVVNYIQRAMVNIHGAQQQIISDYASNCLSELSTCYNTQYSNVNSWTTGASLGNIQKVMSGACRNIALTCGYAVLAKNTEYENKTDPNDFIEGISQVFYQTLLCPDNSEYVVECKDNNNCVNNICRCNEHYYASENTCVWAEDTECKSLSQYLDKGKCQDCPFGTEATSPTATSCTCKSGYTIKTVDGACYKNAGELEIKSVNVSDIKNNQFYWDVVFSNNESGINKVRGKTYCVDCIVADSNKVCITEQVESINDSNLDYTPPTKSTFNYTSYDTCVNNLSGTLSLDEAGFDTDERF